MLLTLLFAHWKTKRKEIYFGPNLFVKSVQGSNTEGDGEILKIASVKLKCICDRIVLSPSVFSEFHICSLFVSLVLAFKSLGQAIIVKENTSG